MNHYFISFKASSLLGYGVLMLFVQWWCLQQSFAQKDTLSPRKKTARTDEITVIALRQPEKVQEVPLAVTVIPVELFQHGRGFGLDEALSLVPGALVQSRTGNQDVRVTIRGFGARGAGERSNAGTSRGVRFYVDGIPETEPDGRTAFDLIDLSGASSIEVLRSNASALWGNASGGVVNISMIPTTNSPFVAAQAQFGSFGFQKQSVRASTPTDFGKVFISVNNTNFAGWRAQSQSALQQAYAGIVTNLSAKSRLNVFMTAASNAFQIPGPLTEAQFHTDPTQAQNDPAIYSPTYVQRNERRFNRLGRIGTTFEHDFDANNSISATAFLQSKYLQRSERNTFRDFTRYHTGGNLIFRNHGQVAEGVRHSLVAGLDQQYQDGAILFYNLVNGNRGTTLRDNRREGANNFGAFAQGELMFGENFSILAALRYDNITYFYDNFINPKLNEIRTFERVTPKIGLSYKLAPSMTLYGNIGGGVEVPAGNETDPPSVFGEDTLRSINPLLKPIESTTYEIGVKHVFMLDTEGFIERISYDVAGYLIDVVNDIVPYRGGRFYFTAGRSRRFGAEIGINAQFVGGLSLIASGTFMQSRYVEYRIDSGFVSRALEGRFSDFAGNAMPGIPDFFATARVRYSPTFFPQVFAEVEYRTVGRYFANDANTVVAPAFSVVDAVIGIKQGFADDRLFVNAFVRGNNLTNAQYVGSIWINPDRASNGQYPYIEPGLPFNYVASLGVEVRL